MARLSCTEESGHPLAHPFADVGEEELVAESNRCAGVERVSPAEMIVLDANILIRAVLGRRVRQLVETYAAQGVRFFAPDIAFDDAHKYARIENRFLLRSASLRAGLRREEELLAFITQHLRASVCAKAAPPLARHAGLLSLLSFAPVGAGSSPIQRLDSHF